MSGICLLAGVLLAPLGDTITLRWTHSVQRSVWEEDWRLDGDALRLAQARVAGTGAGMEPPPEARLEQGAWRWVPALAPLPRLQLWHSPHVAPHVVCAHGVCRPVPEWLPGLPGEAVVELAPCPPTTANAGAR